MKRSWMALLVVLIVAALLGLWSSPAKAQDDFSKMVAIQVNDMHCAECAKKIAAKLYAVPGVVRVKAKIDTHTAYVVPQQDKMPSPRALWEATESAGFKVEKLTTPAGQVYSQKP